MPEQVRAVADVLAALGRAKQSDGGWVG